MSALLMTISSGTEDAPTSAMTVRTASICDTGSGCEPSTTCRIRSVRDLFQRRSERLDQLVRQVTNEPNHVRHRVYSRLAVSPHG
jgi:hypothetical protein